MIDVLLGFAALVVFPGAIAAVMDVAHDYDPSDKLIRSFVYAALAGIGAAAVLSKIAGSPSWL